MGTVSPSPFTTGCGDEQEVLGGNSAPISFPLPLLLHCCWHHVSDHSPGRCGTAVVAAGQLFRAHRHPCGCRGCLEPAKQPRAQEYLGTLVSSPVSCGWFQSSWHKMVYSNSSGT